MAKNASVPHSQIVISIVLGSMLSLIFFLGVRVSTLPSQLLDDPILTGQQDSTQRMLGSSLRGMYHFDSPIWMVGVIIGTIFFSWIILRVIRRAT